MHEIEIILTGIATTFILHFMFFGFIDSKILPDKKPFNCVFCLSLWIAIGMTALTFSWYTVFIPIAFHYSTKLLDRWT